VESVLTPVPTDLGSRAKTINRYAMPFAVIVVLLGVICGSPVGHAAQISIGLLLFGSVFNLWSAHHISRIEDPKTFISVRLWVNLIANGALVWILGGVWSPCWLLLALTPLASGIYGSRTRTLTMGLGVSAFILLRYLVQSHFSPIEMGEQLTYCAFVIFASLMVGDLTKPQGPAS